MSWNTSYSLYICVEMYSIRDNTFLYQYGNKDNLDNSDNFETF